MIFKEYKTNRGKVDFYRLYEEEEEMNELVLQEYLVELV